MNIRIRQMTETAILIALAVLLDLLFKAIPILKMPTGGSFSLTMLPLIINGYRNGLKWGIISGLAYAVINFALMAIIGIGVQLFLIISWPLVYWA